MAEHVEKLTPAMKQYAFFKKQHPDCILFFRMGDFYETFYEDAKICSRICGLALTSRSKGQNPVPLAGVPYHAVDGYLKKMITAGYKVAVCEQVEDPKTAKGVVKRDVVRVVTAGTVTDDSLLDARRANFLCAIHFAAGPLAAVSRIDVSTGHFFVQQIPNDQLIGELAALPVAECLLADTSGELFEHEAQKLATNITQATGAVLTVRPAWYFEPYQARRRLLKHFGTATLEGFGISDTDDDMAGAAGAIIEYLNETQKTSLGHISSLSVIRREKYLQIDASSMRSLEILKTMRADTRAGSLLESIDATQTGMGARALGNWLCMPLCDLEAIRDRQDVVERLIAGDGQRNRLRKVLAEVVDIERIAARISTARASARDLVALASTLRRIPSVRGIMAGLDTTMAAELAKDCDDVDQLAAHIEQAINPDCPNTLRDGGVIRPGYDRKLDELRDISGGGRDWLANYQSQQANLTGIPNLKVGYNRVFGYYIEIGHSHAGKAPDNYVRKQTVKNAERYITGELKTWETTVLGADEKAIALEQQLFDQIRRRAAEYTGRLQKTAWTIAACDCLASMAHIASQRNYVRPAVTGGNELVITDGRHPVLAEILGPGFVPNDLAVGDGAGDCVIITGPNMSGKSTYIRQTALLVLMAQTGSFIPAKEASIGLVDRIFTRIGAADEILKGQSTFMVEMTETANILNNATNRSLVILDEIGRGTSTYDGLSLAWAITEYIATRTKCRTLFATHYHELTELAELFENVRNCNVAVREWMGEVVFLHRIVPGGTDKSYGIHVAKLAGIPASVLERSGEILDELETTFTREASGRKLSRHKTRQPDADLLFVQKHKPVLEKLAATDINNLTPIEAMNLLADIKSQML